MFRISYETSDIANPKWKNQPTEFDDLQSAIDHLYEMGFRPVSASYTDELRFGYFPKPKLKKIEDAWLDFGIPDFFASVIETERIAPVYEEV